MRYLIILLFIISCSSSTSDNFISTCTLNILVGADNFDLTLLINKDTIVNEKSISGYGNEIDVFLGDSITFIYDSKPDTQDVFIHVVCNGLQYEEGGLVYDIGLFGFDDLTDYQYFEGVIQ